MKRIRNILEEEGIRDFLKRRGILGQYKKSAKYVLSRIHTSGLDFKEKKPTGSNVRSFRINRQYRAIGFIDKENDLIIVKFNDHQ